MSHHTTEQGVLFADLSKKAVVARFDQRRSSSDGGAILLKACDERLGLSAGLAACLSDGRQRSKVAHTLEALFRQRMFGIACGYADCNDAARLADDPVMKLLVGRDPASGASLASQPTLSRFENAPRRGELLRLSEALAESVVARHRRRRRGRARRITIDLDPTVDPSHGGQQGTLFSGFHRTWCHLPLAGFLTFDDEAEQYLFCHVLRGGQAAATDGMFGLLRRLLPRLRRAFPGARLRIRLDSGFMGPEMFDLFEAEGLEYAVGMAKNDVLLRLAEPLMAEARAAFEAGEESRRLGEFAYRARSWPRQRRVVVRAEVAEHFGRQPKDSPRFVVTNIEGTPRHVCETVCCARGDAENRIKELKHGLQIDRTSCTGFLANQFRALMTAAACVLLQELRLRARRTGCARAQIGTLRLRLLKLGAWVESSVRRVVLHLPAGAPFADDWRRIAVSVGAVKT